MHTTWGLPAPETVKQEETPLLQQVKANQNQVPRISLVESGSVCWQVGNAACFPKVWELDGPKEMASESEPTQKEETIPSRWKKPNKIFFPILENETKDYKDVFCVLQSYAFSETSQLFVVFWARSSTLNTGYVWESGGRLSEPRTKRTSAFSGYTTSFLFLPSSHKILSFCYLMWL